MRNKQMTERMVAEMVLEEFKKNNNFSFNIPQQVIEETKKEEKMYEPSRISVWDAFTLILFTLYLLELIDICFAIVFVPMLIPYVIIGIVALVSWIRVKIANKKNKTKKLEV